MWQKVKHTVTDAVTGTRDTAADAAASVKDTGAQYAEAGQQKAEQGKTDTFVRAPSHYSC